MIGPDRRPEKWTCESRPEKQRGRKRERKRTREKAKERERRTKENPEGKSQKAEKGTRSFGCVRTRTP